MCRHISHLLILIIEILQFFKHETFSLKFEVKQIFSMDVCMHTYKQTAKGTTLHQFFFSLSKEIKDVEWYKSRHKLKI